MRLTAPGQASRPKFHASRSPEHMPCPMNGGIRSRGVAGDQQPLPTPALCQQRAEAVDRVAEPARRRPGFIQGDSNAQTLSSPSKSSAFSPGLIINSHRQLATHARHDGGRARGVAPLRSIGNRQIREIVGTDVDHQPLRVEAVIEQCRTPSTARTMLLAPSQPTTCPLASIVVLRAVSALRVSASNGAIKTLTRSGVSSTDRAS